MSPAEERATAEQAQRVKQILETLDTPQMLAELQLKARYRRAVYESCLAAGFNAGQALWLCTQN